VRQSKYQKRDRSHAFRCGAIIFSVLAALREIKNTSQIEMNFLKIDITILQNNHIISLFRLTLMHYKRPESILVVIYTKAAEILLMQRSDVPTFWQSVTGSLHEGETAIEAAKREVWEETGLIADQAMQDCYHQNRFEIKSPWRARYAPDVTHNTEHVFTLALPKPQAIQLNPNEHTCYDWLPRLEALEKVTSYTNRDAILKYVQPK
jgi:dATP pyrophosphohydrolase